ncbi:MAG TPA: hypothetical protein PKD24_08810 [Pyrinomonadaceae bacterium]|nr:hypothetical protein [Pyrinomonadaceae bacterium]HMP65831.1 hypothetical protein [Pyrinomonadaceae bacterium]
MRLRARRFFSISAVRSPSLLSALVLISALTAAATAQERPFDDLPKTIRGYKVHNKTIVVSGSLPGNYSNNGTDVQVKVGDPSVAETALAGITLALPVDFTSLQQSGRVDFITFYNVRVNGIPISVEEYRHRFEFRKCETRSLPEPAQIFVPTGRILQAAWLEMRDHRPQWSVTGRVFVFGKFRRFGILHKRVVPVDFDISVANPL